jgi:hypothetical protein
MVGLMNILIFMIVVLVVLVLALYAVTLLPFMATVWFARPLLMFLCVVIAAYAIARKAGWV